MALKNDLLYILAIIFPFLFGQKWYLIDRTDRIKRSVKLSQMGLFFSIINTLLGCYGLYLMNSNPTRYSVSLKPSPILQLGDQIFAVWPCIRISAILLPIWIFFQQQRQLVKKMARVESKLIKIDKKFANDVGLQIVIFAGGLLLIYFCVHLIRFVLMTEMNKGFGFQLNVSRIVRLITMIAFTFSCIFDLSTTIILIGRRFDQINEILYRIRQSRIVFTQNRY